MDELARGFRNSPNFRVQNTVKLTARKIEKQKVAVVHFGINERGRDGSSSGMVESVELCLVMYLVRTGRSPPNLTETVPTTGNIPVHDFGKQTFIAIRTAIIQTQA